MWYLQIKSEVRISKSETNSNDKNFQNLKHQFYSIYENLVLWARSEIIGSALLNKEFLNPKHEMRKTKQYRMTKIKMIQTKGIAGVAM